MKTALIPLIAATVLAAFAAMANAQQAVILVRHAELQGAAMAEPQRLPLSEAGEARAKRLAYILKDSGVGAIYVTDFVRTNKTAEPLSRELNKEMTVLPKGDPRELVERLRKDHGGQTVLLVGHTDTLPGLLKALGHPVDIKIEPQDYSNIFMVIPKSDGAPTFLRLRYLRQDQRSNFMSRSTPGFAVFPSAVTSAMTRRSCLKYIRWRRLTANSRGTR